MEAIVKKGIIYPRMRTDCQWNCRITLHYCRGRNGGKELDLCGWDVRSLHSFDGAGAVLHVLMAVFKDSGQRTKLLQNRDEQIETFQKKKKSASLNNQISCLCKCVCVFLWLPSQKCGIVLRPWSCVPKGWRHWTGRHHTERWWFMVQGTTDWETTRMST